MWSLAGTLDTLAPRVPQALVPGVDRARLRASAARVGAQITDCVYFETWLTGSGSRTDLIVRIDERGRLLLARRPDTVLDAEEAARPAWRRVIEFARAWSSPRSRLAALFESAWLEFDLPPEGGATLPEPRVFLDFTRRSLLEDPPALRLRGAMEALSILAGDALAAGADARLARCFESLPAGVSLPYIGWSPGEPQGALRVCVRGLRGRVAAGLERLGWPGDAARLERELIGPLSGAEAPRTEPAIVHLDVVSPRAARVGLEYPLVRSHVLDRFVERGWCPARTREAVLAWPGRSTERLPHELWHTQVERRASHVKATWAANEPVAAKVYLSLVLRPSSAGTLLGTRSFVPRAQHSHRGHPRPGATG